MWDALTLRTLVAGSPSTLAHSARGSESGSPWTRTRSVGALTAATRPTYGSPITPGASWCTARSLSNPHDARQLVWETVGYRLDRHKTVVVSPPEGNDLTSAVDRCRAS